METRTIYVPANHLGRSILNSIWENVSCSFGEIQKIYNVLRVPITVPQREINRIEKILQKFDLM